MNRLPDSIRAMIVRCLTDGMGTKATARATQTSKGAVLRILEQVGDFAIFYCDFRLCGLTTPQLELDEQWSFVHTRQNRAKQDTHGDIYTFAAFCRESKLAVSWLVVDRSAENTDAFVEDVAARTVGRVQVSTDGWGPYQTAISRHFGYKRVNYAVVI